MPCCSTAGRCGRRRARALAAPTQALAQALADEWEAQREVIDPAAMPLTRLANSIIDGVADAPAAVQAEVAKFLGSDLVCYRAGSPDGLVARQAQHWDPLIAWARDALGARFVLGEGVDVRRAAGRGHCRCRCAPFPRRAVAARRGQRHHDA